MSGLSGRAAIVSGAAGGIGQAVATLLAREGAGVVLGDLDGEACVRLAKELQSADGPGRVAGCRLDVTSPDDWSHAVRLARRRFRHPTILVNCAGLLSVQTLESLSEREWHQVVDVCQRGSLLGIRAVLASMRVEGGGTIVNITSVYGHVGSGAATAYHMAKGAVRALTKAAAVELAGQGIRVNAVCPGLIDTPMTSSLPEGFVADFVAATPLGRLGTPADVAGAVLFLVSDDAGFVTGAELVVDGGYTAR